MAKDVDICKLMMDTYKPEDIVAYVAKRMNTITNEVNKALSENNMNLVVTGVSAYGIMTQIMRELDKKMNGEKPVNIV